MSNSHALQRLQDTIDDVGIFPTEASSEDGDYESCVVHMRRVIDHQHNMIKFLEAQLAAKEPAR